MAAALSAKPWTQMADGVALDVRLTARGGRDAIEGVEHLADGRCVLKARVRAAPFDGAANAALAQLVAKALGLAPRRVELTGGATARVKRLHISGSAGELDRLLDRLIQDSAKASTKTSTKIAAKGTA